MTIKNFKRDLNEALKFKVKKIRRTVTKYQLLDGKVFSYKPSAEKLCTYSFKQRECLQLHCFCFLGVPSFASTLGLGLDFGDSGFLRKKNNSV